MMMVTHVIFGGANHTKMEIVTGKCSAAVGSWARHKEERR
jgi:hypothetical protein